MATIANRNEINLLLRQYAAVLQQTMQVDAIYLFGSYVKGEANPDSDIDVMVLSPDFTDDVMKNQMQLLHARRTIDLRIEPHPIKTEMLQKSALFEMVAQSAVKVV
jgi:predicted nucleotidyltransferase